MEKPLLSKQLEQVAYQLAHDHKLKLGTDHNAHLHLRPQDNEVKTLLHVAIPDLGGDTYHAIVAFLTDQAEEFGFILHAELSDGEFNLLIPNTDESIE